MVLGIAAFPAVWPYSPWESCAPQLSKCRSGSWTKLDEDDVVGACAWNQCYEDLILSHKPCGAIKMVDFPPCRNRHIGSDSRKARAPFDRKASADNIAGGAIYVRDCVQEEIIPRGGSGATVDALAPVVAAFAKLSTSIERQTELAAEFEKPEVAREAPPLDKKRPVEIDSLRSAMRTAIQWRGGDRTEKKRGDLKQVLLDTERSLGQNHVEVATALADLANLCGCMGEFQEQRLFLERALSILEQNYGPNHAALISLIKELGTVCIRLGDQAHGSDLLKHAVDIQVIDHSNSLVRSDSELTFAF